jgi:hypothetical protein
MARLQRVVDVAAAAKLGVDMNGLAVMRPAAAPRWLADATDAELHTAHRTFWSGCAAQFKGQGAILAFDLINEPIQPDRRTASLSGGCVPAGSNSHGRYCHLDAPRCTLYIIEKL